jgi:hypothetical protein
MDPNVLIALMSALVAALGAYFISSRQFSGKIDSSEARDLWAESAAIREWSRTRIEQLERENRELRERDRHNTERIAQLELRLQQLEGEDAPKF